MRVRQLELVGGKLDGARIEHKSKSDHDLPRQVCVPVLGEGGLAMIIYTLSEVRRGRAYYRWGGKEGASMRSGATERDEIIGTILRRVCQLRQDRGLTSEDIGRPAGLPGSTVRMFMNGDRLTARTAIYLAYAWPMVGEGINLEHLAMLDMCHRQGSGRAEGEGRET